MKSSCISQEPSVLFALHHTSEDRVTAKKKKKQVKRTVSAKEFVPKRRVLSTADLVVFEDHEGRQFAVIDGVLMARVRSRDEALAFGMNERCSEEWKPSALRGADPDSRGYEWQTLTAAAAALRHTPADESKFITPSERDIERARLIVRRHGMTGCAKCAVETT